MDPGLRQDDDRKLIGAWVFGGLRRDDGIEATRPRYVIPAQAGIQERDDNDFAKHGSLLHLQK